MASPDPSLTTNPLYSQTPEDLRGLKVVDVAGKKVGKVKTLVLGPDGKSAHAVISSGGFLGLGEKEVALGSDNLAFMTDADGNKYLYTNFSKEQLDAVAAYDKSTYTEKRDDQRLMMTQ